MGRRFVEDPALSAAFVGAADEFVEEAVRTHPRLLFDYSEASVEQVETVADTYYRTKPQAPPDDPELDRKLRAIANDIGAYIGEVFRRHHGGTWGRIIDDDSGEAFPGFRSARGQFFWPTGRARKRLTDGAEENIWHYYLFLVRHEEGKR